MFRLNNMTDTVLDVEGIERCTIAAVAPLRVHTLAKWLLAMDGGSMGRAASAVPLSHGADNADPALIATIVAQYASHGMQAKFRLPDVSAFAPFVAHLRTLGYQRASPTLVQTTTNTALCEATASALAAHAVTYEIKLANEPDEGWVRVFAKGNEPSVDDLERVSNYRRGAGVVFASLRQANDQSRTTVAAGAAAFSHGWACVHGLNTLPAYRGQGLGSSVLAALAQAAQDRGVQRVMLQVEEDNTGAQALYRRLGFSTAWRYVYWQLP
jgi:N-acetylglutamate synthase